MLLGHQIPHQAAFDDTLLSVSECHSKSFTGSQELHHSSNSLHALCDCGFGNLSQLTALDFYDRFNHIDLHPTDELTELDYEATDTVLLVLPAKQLDLPDPGPPLSDDVQGLRVSGSILHDISLPLHQLSLVFHLRHDRAAQWKLCC